MEPVVALITGPMAAGKTTVARLVAARFPRGVHLEGGLFRRSIVSGREEVTPDLRPGWRRPLRTPTPAPASPSRSRTSWRAGCSGTTGR